MWRAWWRNWGDWASGETWRGMARFGIRAKKVFGVSKPKMDELAKRIGRNHELGLALWKTGFMMHGTWRE